MSTAAHHIRAVAAHSHSRGCCARDPQSRDQRARQDTCAAAIKPHGANLHACMAYCNHTELRLLSAVCQARLTRTKSTSYAWSLQHCVCECASSRTRARTPHSNGKRPRNSSRERSTCTSMSSSMCPRLIQASAQGAVGVARPMQASAQGAVGVAGVEGAAGAAPFDDFLSTVGAWLASAVCGGARVRAENLCHRLHSA